MSRELSLTTVGHLISLGGLGWALTTPQLSQDLAETTASFNFSDSRESDRDESYLKPWVTGHK